MVANSKAPFFTAKARLRLALFALLVCLILCLMIQGVPLGESAGPATLTDASNKLIQAYLAVQKADALGAPPQDIAQMSADLNTALVLYGNASRFASEGNQAESALDAGLSLQISSNVTVRALALQSEAEAQATNARVVAYLTAVVLAALSALLIMEYHRVPNFFRKRRLMRMRIE
jgi:hypothetical protein